MVDGELGIRRGYELRLLRCTISLPPSDPPLDESQPGTHQHDSLMRSLLSSIEAGEYLGALASDATKIILGDSEFNLVDSVDSAEQVYSQLLDKVESFVVNDSSDEIDKGRRAVLVMFLAIAAAFWFNRCNLTGCKDRETIINNSASSIKLLGISCDCNTNRLKSLVTALPNSYKDVKEKMHFSTLASVLTSFAELNYAGWDMAPYIEAIDSQESKYFALRCFCDLLRVRWESTRGHLFVINSLMALNSLYPDGWFALGSAALKARDVQKALDAFTFAVQLDPDNGEAWNNIACLHMIKKRSKEPFIAFKEALKFKRDSWQMWENFSNVAMDVVNMDQAFEALQQILKMSKNKRIDVVLMDRIMTELESRNSVCKSPSSSNEIEGSSDESTETKPCAATTAETQRHLELLGKIIQQIVKTEVWKDNERFKKFAGASLELCRVYMEISVSTGSKRELFSAEMHLKNTIKQATVSFPDSEELKELESCLEEVRSLLHKSEEEARNTKT